MTPQPTEQPIDLALSRAITEATKERLHIVLYAILQQNPEAAATASSLLLVDDSEAVTDVNGGPSPRKPVTKKRKRFEHCIQCEEEFDVTDNTDNSCNWHDGTHILVSSFGCLWFLCSNSITGDLEVDEDGDFWADHDDEIHGNRYELQEEYPEGYIWSCCNKRGDQEGGCQVGKHSAD